MSDAPWVRWFASDFLNGVVDLDAEERGVYVTVLSLIFDRGAPIENDAAWLARRCGCSTRRFNKIRDRLVADGKLEIRAGMIGNRRALDELKRRKVKSDKAQRAAFARWHGDLEPELDLDAKPPKNERKNGQTSPEQNDLNSPVKSEKRRKSANSDDANASGLARARKEPELESRESPPTANPPAPRARVRAREAVVAEGDKWDLLGITNHLARIGGVSLHRETTRVRAMDLVRSWIDEGVDIEGVAIPAIEQQRRDTRETRIGGLEFYASRVAKAHADAIDKGHVPRKPMTPEETEAHMRSTIALYRRIGRTEEADLLERQMAKKSSESANPG